MEAAIQRRYITIIASLQRIIMYCTLPRCEVMWTNFLSNTASRFCVPLRLFHLLFSSLASVLQYEFGDILLHNLLPLQPLCQGWNHLNNSPNRGHLHFIRMQENIYLYVKCVMWYKKKQVSWLPYLSGLIQTQKNCLKMRVLAIMVAEIKHGKCMTIQRSD